MWDLLFGPLLLVGDVACWLFLVAPKQASNLSNTQTTTKQNQPNKQEEERLTAIAAWTPYRPEKTRRVNAPRKQ
jgi:hypothetical protein